MASTWTSRRRVRLLCLHGFRQSALQFSGRLAALRKRMQDQVEFVFVDGPAIVPPLPRASIEHADERASATAAGATAEVAAAPAAVHSLQAARRAWFTAPPDTDPVLDESQPLTQTEHWLEALQYLADVLEREQPFDGLLGFSQGGSLAAALLALQQQWHEHDGAGDRFASESVLPVSLVQRLCPLLRFRFALLFSAYLPSPVPLQRLVQHTRIRPDMCPVMLVGGRTDRQTAFGARTAALAEAVLGTSVPTVVSLDDRDPGELTPMGMRAPADERATAAVLDGGQTKHVLVWHGRGHLVPSSRAAVTLYRTFIAAHAPQTGD